MATGARTGPKDQALTLFLPEGAISGRVLQFLETGLMVHVEGTIPRDERFRFTLHLQGRVIAGELASMGQEERVCRLQFTALTPGDRDLLEPWIEA